ncbi:MAG: PHP domain-containing protein, partial [Thiotrichaceae bacterium]|nr:PHP domain-containing protein [Thiotrichaceae bacterium]
MLNKTCDLHIHSHYSDSTLTPKDIVRAAKTQGLSCVALTDHDTAEGVPPTIEAGRRIGIEVLTGIELSSEVNGRDVHILGYLFDAADEAFTEKLGHMQNTRVERMGQMIDKCKEFGIDNITLDEVAALAKTDSLGRPHLAQIMVEKKWVPNIKAAFDKYLADNAPVYVPKFKQTPFEAIQLIHDAGGVAVLAHPM